MITKLAFAMLISTSPSLADPWTSREHAGGQNEHILAAQRHVQDWAATMTVFEHGFFSGLMSECVHGPDAELGIGVPSNMEMWVLTDRLDPRLDAYTNAEFDIHLLGDLEGRSEARNVGCVVAVDAFHEHMEERMVSYSLGMHSEVTPELAVSDNTDALRAANLLIEYAIAPSMTPQIMGTLTVLSDVLDECGEWVVFVDPANGASAMSLSEFALAFYRGISPEAMQAVRDSSSVIPRFINVWNRENGLPFDARQGACLAYSAENPGLLSQAP